MKNQIIRIDRLKRMILFPLTVLFLFSLYFSPVYSQKTEKGTNQDKIILSLNAYSFNDLLVAKHPGDGQPLFTLFNLIDWCASNEIKAVDLTAYYFPGYPEVPSDEYLLSIKTMAEKAGLAISGTGIRNNFASPDPKVRAEGVELAKRWIVAASKIGAPVIRLFAGEIPKGYEDKWDEVAGWMIDCYKECAVFGEKYGVKIGIQNHGDMLRTAEQCIKIINEIDSDWVGLIVDTGNFKTEDPYRDIEAVVPYAINWQVKESVFGLGSGIRVDCAKLINIIKDQGYKGYLPVETLFVPGKAYDPFFLVMELINELQAAL